MEGFAKEMTEKNEALVIAELMMTVTVNIWCKHKTYG